MSRAAGGPRDVDRILARYRQALGRAGEDLAARHLEAQGYRIIARRYRTRLGEIDLVASRGDLLVFVEVKLRRGRGFGLPAEAVRSMKQARIARVAEQFLGDRIGPGALPTCRFDVVAISRLPGTEPVIEHIEDAFRPDR